MEVATVTKGGGAKPKVNWPKKNTV